MNEIVQKLSAAVEVSAFREEDPSAVSWNKRYGVLIPRADAEAILRIVAAAAQPPIVRAALAHLDACDTEYEWAAISKSGVLSVECTRPNYYQGFWIGGPKHRSIAEISIPQNGTTHQDLLFRRTDAGWRWCGHAIPAEACALALINRKDKP